MSKTRSIFIIGIALLLMLASLQMGSTRAMFSDVATSTGNTFTAGIWYQADEGTTPDEGATPDEDTTPDEGTDLPPTTIPTSKLVSPA